MRRIARGSGWLALAGLSVAALTYLWLDTRHGLNSPDGGCASLDGHRPSVGGLGAAGTLLATGLTAAWMRARALRYRRLRSNSVLWVGAFFAAVAVVLGTAVYWESDGGWRTLAPVARILQLFLGSVDEDLCVGSYPAGMWTALAFAIAATGTGILAAAANTWRGTWERLVVHLGSGLDVIIGVDRGTPALVKALLRDRRQSDSGVRNVVLLTTDPTEADTIRAAYPDVRIVNVDASNPDEMRSVIFGRTWRLHQRVAFNRLFLLHADQLRNMTIHEGVVAAIKASTVRPEDRSVPRIIVRMDDAREAREWRARSARAGDHPAWFSDAISHEGILATEIADFVEQVRCPIVTIVGQTSLAIALLDELALRRWEREDLRRIEMRWREAHPDEAYPAILQEDLRVPELTAVWVVGDSAGVLDEWLAAKPSFGPDEWQLPIAAVSTLMEVAAGMGDEPNTVVVTEACAQEMPTLRALLRQRTGAWTALVPHEDAVGLPLSAVGDAIVRFGPTWTPADAVVEDSWSSLARHQHAVYRHSNAAVVVTRERATPATWNRGPSPELPSFYRLDNLRQLRHIMQSFVALGYTWTFAAGERTCQIPDDDLTAVARAEHRRWCALRRAYGWGVGERDDSRRLSPHLVEWDHLPIDHRNPKTVESIVRRLGETGLTLAPAWSHRRQGVASAERLVTDRSWKTANGSTMRNTAGDWWVVDDTGGGRGVAANRFAEQYVQCAPSRYRRRGKVAARRLETLTKVETLEGPADAVAGDWLVFDGTTRWVVGDVHFRTAYQPLDGADAE
jgi:hypothetical protein